MVFLNYVDRMELEKKELNKRIDKLVSFLEKQNNIGTVKRRLMEKQLTVMIDYLEILMCRLSLEKE